MQASLIEQKLIEAFYVKVVGNSGARTTVNTKDFPLPVWLFQADGLSIQVKHIGFDPGLDQFFRKDDVE
jgi:hypothetical protein